MGFRTWASALVAGTAVVAMAGCGLAGPEPDASHEPDRTVSHGVPGAGANVNGVSAAGKGGKISRSEVIKRAKSWPAAEVPYCLGYPLSQCVGKNYTNAYGTYRADCSGFVSMTWNLSSSLTTSSLPSVATRISKSQLKAGDILNKSGVHVVVFEKWANSAKTEYWAYEQTPPHAIYHKIPYPYHNGGSGYLPYRYKNIVDDAGTVAANAKSVNADAYGDIVSVDSGRAMWLHPGKSSGTFGKRVRIGQGWTTAYNRIAVGDANADGRGDLFATATDGKLYYWQRTAKGFSERLNVGAGWKSIRWFAVADVNGDRRSDILSLNGSTLYLSTGKGNGSFNKATKVGSGWSKYNRIVAGDVNGDGYADLYATTASGELHYWLGKGNGFTYKSRVGNGWTANSRILAVDVNGDRKLDLLGIRTDGAMYYYRGSGAGGFAKAVRLGGGWTNLRVATW